FTSSTCPSTIVPFAMGHFARCRASSIPSKPVPQRLIPTKNQRLAISACIALSLLGYVVRRTRRLGELGSWKRRRDPRKPSASVPLRRRAGIVRSFALSHAARMATARHVAAARGRSPQGVTARASPHARRRKLEQHHA